MNADGPIALHVDATPKPSHFWSWGASQAAFLLPARRIDQERADASPGTGPGQRLMSLTVDGGGGRQGTQIGVIQHAWPFIGHGETLGAASAYLHVRILPNHLKSHE